MSTRRSQVPQTPGRAQYNYVGSTRFGTLHQAEKLALTTAESDTGCITYINCGHRKKGFTQNVTVDGQQEEATFYLLHPMHTDIALWIPQQRLWNQGGVLEQLGNQDLPGGGSRLYPAMQSALYAVVRAAERVLGTAPGEIGGVLRLMGGANGDQLAFVLFDDVSGGAGHVLPLTVRKDEDTERSTCIREVLGTARDIVKDCDCRQGIESGPNTIPIPPMDLLCLQQNNRENYRERVSCPKCLRAFANQHHHHMLDRHDARLVLEAILNAPQGGAAQAPQAPWQPPLLLLRCECRHLRQFSAGLSRLTRDLSCRSVPVGCLTGSGHSSSLSGSLRRK